MSSQFTPWQVRGERQVYVSDDLEVAVAEVWSPSGQQVERNVVRAGSDTVSVLVLNDRDEALLVWCHRFIPNEWNWELPTGGVFAGEDPAQSAVTEVFAKTGWTVTEARNVWSQWLFPELSDLRGHLVVARAVEPDGAADFDELSAMSWNTRDGVAQVLADGKVGDLFSVTALLWWLGHRHPSVVG